MQNRLSAILAFSSTYVHTSGSEDVSFNGKLLSLYRTVGRICKKYEWGALLELYWQGKTVLLGYISPSNTLYTTNHTWTILRRKYSRRCDRPESNHQIQGTVP